MPDLHTINQDYPPTLTFPGSLRGCSVQVDLSTLEPHVNSRAAVVLRAGTSLESCKQVAIKAVFEPDVRPPHDVMKEARILASLSHPNVRNACFSCISMRSSA